MDPRRGAFGFLLFLSLSLRFTIQTGKGGNCEPRICVQQYIIHNVLVGDPLKIFCPVSFCDNSPPSVTWFKHERDEYKPVTMSDRVKTEWKIKGNSEGTSYFIIENVQKSDRGEYQCRAGDSMGHNIKVQVTGEMRTHNWVIKPVFKMIIICSSTTACVLICGVIVSCIYKRICCRRQSQPAVVEGEEMDTYAALQHPSEDLYQAVVRVDSAGDSGSGHHQPLHSEEDYENDNNFAN